MPKRKTPATSIEAYRSITEEQIQAHHSKILGALKDLGAASAEQISTHISLNHWQVNRRMKELEKKELIHKTGARAMTKTGRDAFVWTLGKIGEAPKSRREIALENIYVQSELFKS